MKVLLTFSGINFLSFNFKNGADWFFAHTSSALGFTLALFVISRVFREKRKPGNFFAWFFFVLSLPLIAAPLYLMLGGRKSRYTTRIKKKIREQAAALTTIETNSAPQRGDKDNILKTDSNSLRLLSGGVSYFECLSNEIKAAKHTIHIATYIYGNDASANAITRLLIDRAKDGLTVRVLLDSLGCWNTTRSMRRRLHKAGAEVAMFMPVMPIETHSNANLRNHRKMAIFDNDRVIAGGHNIDERFMGISANHERFMDLSMHLSGPAVMHFSQTFISDWAFASGQAPKCFQKIISHQPEIKGTSPIQFIASGPDMEDDTLWEQILNLVHTFNECLTIITPYFIPDEVIYQSLLVKARVGKKIRLILPLKSNHKITDIARYPYLQKLHTAGVEILFYTPGMLHAKLILVDQSHALLGSANLDLRSLFLNFEIGWLHTSPSDIQAFQDWNRAIIADCISYSDATKDKSKLPSKLTQHFVRLLEPLL